MGSGNFSLFLGGDAMIVDRWSSASDDATLGLFAIMRQCDAAIVNLETVIHTHKGYAQRDSGGSWMTSAPSVAAELAWAGVTMVCHANNHAFDYGSEGILETIGHLERCGIELSGSGADLQRARSPRYVTASGCKLGHVAMASTFIPYGRAAYSRQDHRGRPGVNPLQIDAQPTVTVTPAIARLLEMADRILGRDTTRYRWSQFKKNKMIVSVGERFEFRRGRHPKTRDRNANLAAIGEARATSDIVVVSIHSHDQSPWLRQFISDGIRAGADVVLVHGLHRIFPVEIIDGRPVFYGLGNFAYPSNRFHPQPSDAYEKRGLDPHTDRHDLARNFPAIQRLHQDRRCYESLAAVLWFKDWKPASIRLLPLDLRFGDDGPLFGYPRLADDTMARKLIGRVARLSRRHNTMIDYDPTTNSGDIDIGSGPGP